MNQPTAFRPTTTRMFETELFERFSRIHPATPFVAWIPIGGYFTWRSFALAHLSVLHFVALALAGILTWTLMEYVLHRWVFHWKRDTPFGRRFHFLLHGAHHDYPNDKDRLVMPLGASLPMSTIFYGLFRLALGPAGDALFVGFVVGYLTYDGTHYAIHHFPQRTAVGRWLKKHHMLHHHADHDGGFGVSSPLWDHVFRTLPTTANAKKTAAARAGRQSS